MQPIKKKIVIQSIIYSSTMKKFNQNMHEYTQLWILQIKTYWA